MSSVGMVEIKADNRQLAMSSLRNAMLAGLEEIGLDCEHIASENAPYDTGRLSGSISHAIDADRLAVYIGTNVEYSGYQELGTSTYPGANGGKGYLRPAATENQDRFRAIMKKHLGNA